MVDTESKQNVIQAAVQYITNRAKLSKLFMDNCRIKHGLPPEPMDDKELVAATTKAVSTSEKSTSDTQPANDEKDALLACMAEKLSKKATNWWPVGTTLGAIVLAAIAWLSSLNTSQSPPPVEDQPPIIIEEESSLLQYLEDNEEHLP